MNKIKQVFALAFLCIYFSIKTVALIGDYVIQHRYKTKTKIVNQNYYYLLDSGHGYRDESCGHKAVIEDDGRCFHEWIFNWEVRRHLANMLDSSGIKYIFVNSNVNSDMPIQLRAKKANNIKTAIPKVYISIHANASNMEKKGWEDVEGFEVFSPETKYIIKGSYKNKKAFSDSIATWLTQELMEIFPEHKFRTSGGNLFKEASYTVISKTKCYSILSENEFFTNPKMRNKMRKLEFQKKVAKAHYNLILRLEKKT